MNRGNAGASKVDFEKFRLRRFVDRLIDLGEVEIHDEPVPLTGLSAIIEATDKAVLFRKAGPERIEMVAGTAGSSRRLAAAFGVGEDKLHDEYVKRLDRLQPLIEVPSDEAPVHAIKITGQDVDLARLPFHPQHALDGSCYLSAAIDYAIDPVTGRRNVGCRRLSLRNRYEAGTNVTAPSDLKRIYTACVARGERLPVTFTVGSHPLDFIAATTRQPVDELALVANFRGEAAPVVKSLTNDILVPADAEVTLEGYLDERGYVEPEGPYGEYMGYYGAIHMDPVFHCTAITMRRDALHHTLLHGSAFTLDRADASCLIGLGAEAQALQILRATVAAPVAVHLRTIAGAGTLRVAIRKRADGEPRAAIEALLRGMVRIKSVYLFDDDIDIKNDNHVDWCIGTRFQADQDLIVLEGLQGQTMDPSLNGRRVGAKTGFDCTRPLGRADDITYMRCAARTFTGPARFQTVEQALSTGPMFFADVVESLGSDDGREVACALDGLRQAGRLGRDGDGRYHLVEGRPGVTTIVGELHHDPNHGA
jgi:UbiD family decarboxylase